LLRIITILDILITLIAIMRTFSFAFLIVCLGFLGCKKNDATTTTTTTTTTSNVNLSQGLIAYFPFNGNTNDESGNGNNGTIFNSATIVADKNGKPLSALSVTGANGVIVNNGTTLIPADSMAISFDVMQRQTGNRQIFLSSINYNTGFGFGYYLGPSTAGDSRTIFGIARNHGITLS
jgi:hypothetical protein